MAPWWYVCREILFFKVMPFMTKDSFDYCPLGLKDYYFFSLIIRILPSLKDNKACQQIGKMGP
jgi:hypothetical protein